jgi:glycosyltransferase involved in cell wall biosynthesis
MFRNMIPFDRVQRARYPFGYTKLRNWLLEHLLLSSMQRADLVIFISEYARAVIEKRAPGIIRAAAVIPHGVAHRFRNDGNKAARPFRLPPGEYLLCVSSIDRYKAQIEVVRAYALLRDRRPRLRHYLVLAGPENDHGYANEVRAEITRFGLDGLVLMTGAIPYEELPGLYQHATAHIFASESENCPNILLEAMASGRPVVSSDLPPMPEFGGDAVAYFDPRRPEDLANQLVTVLESAPRADELSRRSMEQSTRHDWRSAAYRTRDALASTTGERTARNGIPART